MHIQQNLRKNYEKELKMTIQELEKELKANIIEGMYLLYGEETFLLESSLKKLKKLFGELVLRYKLYSDR